MLQQLTAAGVNFKAEKRNAHIVDGVFIPKQWQMCNGDITESMSVDHPISAVPAIAHLMQHMPVFLYNGARDLICNHMGATHTLEMTNWNGLYFSDADRGLMMHDGDVFGQYYQLQNLSFLVVRAAGHFVPTDQPSGSLDMIQRFLQKRSFFDVELATDRSYESMPIDPASLDVVPTRGVNLSMSGTDNWSSVLGLSCIMICVVVIAYARRKQLGDKIMYVKI